MYKINYTIAGLGKFQSIGEAESSEEAVTRLEIALEASGGYIEEVLNVTKLEGL